MTIGIVIGDSYALLLAVLFVCAVWHDRKEVTR